MSKKATFYSLQNLGKCSNLKQGMGWLKQKNVGLKINANMKEGMDEVTHKNINYNQ